MWPVETERAFAVTLTQRACPATAADYHAALRAFLMFCRRRGLRRYWWVIEWQKRGHPHVHLILYFRAAWRVLVQDVEFVEGRRRVASAVGAAAVQGGDLVDAWLRLAGESWGARRAGQHAARVDRVVGWLDYLQSHAFRGLKHYQRSGANAPAGWLARGDLGRVWGQGGDWPFGDPVKLVLVDGDWHAYRRRVRAWRVGQASDRLRLAVQAGRPKRVKAAKLELVAAKGCLRSGERWLSGLRGGTMWAGERNWPEELLQGLGFEIEDGG